MSSRKNGEKHTKKITKQKKRRLVPFWLRFAVVGAVAIGLMITAAMTVFPMLGISLKMPFTNHTRISESEILLKEVHPLFKLTTVEYTYKTVFPHDFIPKNSNPERAFFRLQRGEELTAQEQEAARLYQVCRESGIRLWPRTTEFVVLTSRVKGGYNLESAVSERPSNESSKKPSLRIHSNPSLSTVEIRLPHPTITEFVIQDETSEYYQYPDINVDAKQWRIITEYVEDKIRFRVMEQGILDTTERKMKDVLTKLIKSSGWEHIVFTTASDSLR